MIIKMLIIEKMFIKKAYGLGKNIIKRLWIGNKIEIFNLQAQEQLIQPNHFWTIWDKLDNIERFRQNWTIWKILDKVEHRANIQDCKQIRKKY